jgi:predicted unusual protein kinase regulating ubiquinone biosynthesis (AarF/ABC1/UbiB family)
VGFQRFAIALASLAVASLAVAGTLDDDVKSIIRDIGTEVPATELRSIRTGIEVVLERLGKAQMLADTEHNIKSVRNQLYIVDSKTPNVFITTRDLKYTQGVQNNRVIITTAMLNQLLAADPSAYEVVGVLAHELAHPIESNSSKSISSSWGGMLHGQAVEMKTDELAVRLLSLANYPVDSLYKALETSNKNSVADLHTPKKNGLSSAAKSWVDSHPENRLRAFWNRVAVLRYRLKYGEMNSESAPAFAQNQKDIQKLKYYVENEPALENVPNTLAELLSETRKVQLKLSEIHAKFLKGKSRYLDESSLEDQKLFSHLFYTMNERLQSAPPVSKDELELIHAINFEFARSMQYPDAHYRPMDKEFTRSAWFQNRHPTSLENLVENVPLYREPRYLDRIKPNIASMRPEFEAGYAEGRYPNPSVLNQIIPQSELYSYFKEDWRHSISKFTPTTTYLRSINPKSFQKQDQVAFALVHEAEVEKMPAEDRFRFHQNDWPELRLAYSTTFGSTDTTFASSQFSDTSEMIEKRKALSAKIWKRRGEVAAFDMISSSEYVTDWTTIFKDVGISPDAGMKSIREEVKSYIGRPEFSAAVKTALHSEEKLVNSVLDYAPGSQSFSKSKLVWMDLDLMNTLERHFSSTDNEVNRFITHALPSLIVGKQSDQVKEVFEHNLIQELNSHSGLDIRKVSELVKKSEEKLVWHYFREDVETRFGTDNLNINALRAVLKSNIDNATKSAFLTRNLPSTLKGRVDANTTLLNSETDWFMQDDSFVANEAFKLGVVKSETELARLIGPTSKAQYMNRFGQMMDSELTRIEREPNSEIKRKELLDFSDAHFSQWRRKWEPTAPELETFQKRVFAIANEVNLSPRESFELFRSAAAPAYLPAAEAFFESKIRPHLSELVKTPGVDLMDILSWQQLDHSPHKEEVASLWIQHELQRPESTRPNLSKSGAMLDKAYPGKSAEKDRLLEKLAWDYQEMNPAALKMNESRKLSGADDSWDYGNKFLIRDASAYTQYFGDLPPEDIQVLIGYLTSSGGTGFPPALKEKVWSKFVDDSLSATTNTAWRSGLSKQRSAFDQAIQNIETTVRSSSREEKIPLLEYLFHLGEKPLAEQNDFYKKIMHEQLGYAVESDEYKFFRALYLALPSEERAFALAKTVMNPPSSGDAMRSLFEYFNPVGTKAAQAVSVLNLMGERSRELDSLKDRAKALSRAEIISALKEELSPEEFKKIKKVKLVLGSASFKTVVEIELHDGTELVAAIQTPYAEYKMQRNFKIIHDFMKNLREEGVLKSSPLAESYEKSIERQMWRELPVEYEIKQIGNAEKAFNSYNRDAKSELAGWTVSVPSVSKKLKSGGRVLFMDKASGVRFDELPASLHSFVGDVVVDSSLYTLYEKGFFDADRHKGNYLIDVEKKTIHIYDFGQGEEFVTAVPWKMDDPAKIAQFIYAISKKDARALVFAAEAMSDKPLSESDRREAVERISQTFKTPHDDQREELISVLDVLAKSKIVMEEKFGAGAFKGLLLLEAENYVIPERFSNLMGKRVESTLKSKIPFKLLSGELTIDCLAKNLKKKLQR